MCAITTPGCECRAGLEAGSDLHRGVDHFQIGAGHVGSLQDRALDGRGLQRRRLLLPAAPRARARHDSQNEATFDMVSLPFGNYRSVSFAVQSSRRAYSATTPAALITAAHLATSPGSQAAISAGERSHSVMPCLAMASFAAARCQTPRDDRTMQPLDRGGRRLRRREQRKPGVGLDAGNARFGQRRKVRQPRRARLRWRPRARGPRRHRCS